ncbi:hypothetical protein SAMN05216600_105149 [Pseudomonas cuatrocienegasensis]|uniref:HrpT n=1 Tax=Pseudomonas cuatrocienegasensis TaxID=543360 RepID=A0ABY1BA38_9PSED|nr:hypothetical protein SAMN05216600_105149 [Pseudomonas cuatrocienegasensis]
MKLLHAAALLMVALLLGACTTMQTSCFTRACQTVDANDSSLSVWWTPALRNDVTEYTTVYLNE